MIVTGLQISHLDCHIFADTLFHFGSLWEDPVLSPLCVPLVVGLRFVAALLVRLLASLRKLGYEIKQNRS